MHIFLQRMIAGRCWISVMFCSSLRELRKGQLTSRGSFKRYCDTSLQASNGFFTTEYHVVQKLLRQKLECWKREEYGADQKGCEHKRLKQFPLWCWEHDSAPRGTVDKTWSSRLVITFYFSFLFQSRVLCFSRVLNYTALYSIYIKVKFLSDLFNQFQRILILNLQDIRKTTLIPCSRTVQG